VSIAFVVMQIGDPELDRIFESVIQPATEDAGLEVRRVDRHNEGDLLKVEIIRFLKSSEIIIADLTNERPNVYLEVGYAMGIEKTRNLILTCRSDHLPGNAGWAQGGPKIHFDLAGYDILLWEPTKPDDFRQELARRIRYRRRRLSSAPTPPPTRKPASRPTPRPDAPILDEQWTQGHRETAARQMEEAGVRTYMDAAFGVAHPKADRSHSELLKAASESQVHTFGWPIGVVLEREGCRPLPREDGIVTEVNLVDDSPNSHYDYWALRRNGDFYLRKSLFEDQRDKEAIFFNTRIVRNTELLMYALRLYKRLGIDASAEFAIELRYGGLSGRVLRGTAARYVRPRACTAVGEFRRTYGGRLQEADADLTKVVKELTEPMFALFEFGLSDSIYRSIVEAYADGQIT